MKTPLNLPQSVLTSPNTSGIPGIGAITGPICQENLITISVKIRIVTITLIFNTHLETAEKD